MKRIICALILAILLLSVGVSTEAAERYGDAARTMVIGGGDPRVRETPTPRPTPKPLPTPGPTPIPQPTSAPRPTVAIVPTAAPIGDDYTDPDNELTPEPVETDAPADEPTEAPATGEPANAADGRYLTPDGNADLVDDLHDGERDFITVQTRSGEYFYIIIDRTQGGQNVYFLNKVDSHDLLSLLDEKTINRIGCTCSEKCTAGHVDESCPVCATNMSECTGREAEPQNEGQGTISSITSSPEPTNASQKPSPLKGYISLGLIAVIVIGIIVMFLRKNKSKKTSKSKEESFIDDYDDDDDDENYGKEYVSDDDGDESTI